MLKTLKYLLSIWPVFVLGVPFVFTTIAMVRVGLIF